MANVKRLIGLLTVLFAGVMLGGCANPSMQFDEALKSKDTRKVKSILEEHPEIVNGKSKCGLPFLVLVAEDEKWDIVLLMLAKGADVNLAYGDYTALRCAAQQGNKEMVKLLLAKGAHVNIRGIGTGGRYPLEIAANPEIADILREEIELVEEMHEAAKEGNLKKVKSIFINKPTLVNPYNKVGHTLLYTAAENGQKKVVDFLITNGAMVNGENWGVGHAGTPAYTPLQTAAWRGHKDVAELLIANGAEINTTDSTGTPLLFAAESGNAEMVEFVISKGGDPNLRSRGDLSALDIAAQKGYPIVAEVLIANGAKVNSKDDSGWIALFYAAREGHKEIAELLIAKGAHVNAKSYKHYISGLSPTTGKSGRVLSGGRRSPLHVAAIYGHKEIAQVLIANGAKVNAKNVDGDTPLDIALGRGHKEVAELLRKHGAVKGD